MALIFCKPVICYLTGMLLILVKYYLIKYETLLILVKYYLIKYETLFAFHKLPVFDIVHPTHFAGFQIQHIRTFSFDIQLCVLCLC